MEEKGVLGHYICHYFPNNSLNRQISLKNQNDLFISQLTNLIVKDLNWDLFIRGTIFTPTLSNGKTDVITNAFI